MTFATKLKDFDSSKVHFSTDSIFSPLTGFSWELDSTRKKLALNYPWQENLLYNLVFEKDFATDTFGYQLLKPDTISFKGKSKRDYGKLILRFRNLDLTQNPVLLFIQNNEVKKSFPLDATTFSQELFLPGEYSLRILNDKNENGIWDPGVFFGQRQQPEMVKPLQRTLNIRPGLDNTIDIDVNAVPVAEDKKQPTQNRDLRNRPNNTRPTNRF
jgi:hypothetical protein